MTDELDGATRSELGTTAVKIAEQVRRYFGTTLATSFLTASPPPSRR